MTDSNDMAAMFGDPKPQFLSAYGPLAEIMQAALALPWGTPGQQALLRAIAKHRLAAEPQPAPVEPVAWHLTDVQGRMSQATDRRADADAWREQGFIVTPLYAHPPRAAQTTPPEDVAAQFDRADWFWRTMDPDDCGDSPSEAINRAMVGNFCVCEIASSYTGPIRYGFIAPALDPESDDEEFVHFATQDEAIEAAKARAALAKQGGA